MKSAAIAAIAGRVDPFQAPATSQTTSSVFSVHDHIFRLGVNYHFN